MGTHEYVTRAPRYTVQLAVEYRLLTANEQSSTGEAGTSSSWRTGTSHNISSSGILFSPDNIAPEFTLAAAIELRLLMPAELNPAVAARARCVGRIVRLEPTALEGPMRVAATIDQYKFEREARN